MNRAQLRARAIFLAAQAGWTDATPPDGYATMPDYWDALLQQAYQDLAFETEYHWETDTFTTVVGQAEYILSDVTIGERAFIKITEAVYRTDTPLNPATEEEIRRTNNLWLMAESADPTWFWTSSSGTFRLYPPPSSAETLTVRGPREPKALLLETSEPTCPQSFHEAIPLKTVLLMAESWIEDDMDLARIARYENSYARLASKLKRHAGDDDAEVQRYVTPRLPRRVPQTLDTRRGY